MSYKDLSKIIPDEKSDTSFLDKIIDENESSSSSYSSSSEDESIPANLPRMSFYSKSKPEKIKPVKKDNTEDKKVIICQLKRWQMSYSFFEEKNINIPASLKEKVTKALCQGFDVKLSVLEALVNELKFVSGVDVSSPPIQADMILHGVNPLVENVAVSYGYDITGFSNVAAVTCKMPLIMALIENDVMCGKKPSPLIMLGLVYAQTLAGVYAQNKARVQQQQPKPQTVTVESSSAAAALPPLSDPTPDPAPNPSPDPSPDPVAVSDV